jgi:23S rRNA (adenine2503-C2)-methyltransferase
MDTEVKLKRQNKISLKGFTLNELKDYFSSIGESRFRGEQVFIWFYKHLIDSYGEMKNIPKNLQVQLSESTASINTLKLISTKSSQETGTTKYLFETKDGYKIESVVIPEVKRTTLCISTQVGCPLDCKFCATGLMGYSKNLSAGEIFDQYKLSANEYTKSNIKNIVYMGMGEPLLNYDETLKSLKIFADDLIPEPRLKRITVSTVGIAPRIVDLANTGIRVKLAFSLHSCFEDIRSKLIPINKKYSLRENLDAIRYYTKKTQTKITFEYLMLRGINDREEDLRELVKLCNSLPSKINVIPFNSLNHMNPRGFSAELQPSSKKRIYEFVNALKDQNINVRLRYTTGEDIAAACGQLAFPQ